MTNNIAEAFQGLKIKEIEVIIKKKLEDGTNPHSVIKECQDEMAKIGKKFESGEYFLAELVISAKMFEKVMGVVLPKLKEIQGEKQKFLGKIVLGTPKGDIHDLGKNIFSMLAQIAGFEIIDLGVDVSPQKFLENVKKENPEIVGMSGLMTTVYPSMKQVVDLLKEQGIRDRVKVIIGGGAISEEVRRYLEADACTLDAIEGIRLCQGFVKPLIEGEKR